MTRQHFVTGIHVVMALGVQGLKPEAQEQQRAGRSAREIGDDLIAQAMAMSGDFVATLNQNFLTSVSPCTPHVSIH